MQRVFLACLLWGASVAGLPNMSEAAALKVSGAWVRLPLPGTDAAAVYMVLRNDGDADLTLDSVQTAVAAHAGLHRVSRRGGMMRMEAVDRLSVPAHGTVVLAPGRMHVMLEGLKRALKAGERVRLMLHSNTGEMVTVVATVRGSVAAVEPAGDKYRQGMAWLADGNATKAAGLLRRAAEQGNRRAQYQLGLLYARGDGVRKDLTVARDWLRKAAMQGHPKAQFFLGQMYAFGDGGPKDNVRATMWFWLAATLGDRFAKDSLRVMTGKISAREVAEAKKEAKALWQIMPHDMKIKRRMAMH